MSSSRLVRGAKTRMFAMICLFCVLGAVVFVFHGTQAKLAEVQKLVNSCNQQQESLSAQLQVIFEYKVRLEKSLTKEKEDHKQTKDNFEAKLKEEKSNREKDNQEAKNKYEALVQQNKFLQNQLDDLKENEKNQVSKLSDDNKNIQKELEQLRKEKNELIEQKTQELEELKEKVKELAKENDDIKTRGLPESAQKNYLETQNSQLKDEVEKVKKQLQECDLSKNAIAKPKVEIEQDTNVGKMPQFVYNGQKYNGSTTPGLNPDAVNNFEVSVSSPKPKDLEQSPANNKKQEEQVGQAPPKKPTQESVMPIPVPRQQDVEGHVGQIPVPGNIPERDPFVNTLQKPNVNNGLAKDSEPQVVPAAFIGDQGGKPDAVQPEMFVQAPLDPNKGEEEEENFQRQPEIPRLKNGENYPQGDYEREKPDDEEDDEGELEYVNERSKKEQKNMIQQQPKQQVPNHDNGVMVNPK